MICGTMTSTAGFLSTTGKKSNALLQLVNSFVPFLQALNAGGIATFSSHVYCTTELTVWFYLLMKPNPIRVLSLVLFMPFP